MVDRVGIFIDGAYLEHVQRNQFGGARIDFGELSNAIADGADILRTYYYHCLPYQGNPPTTEERERYANRRRFFTMLETLPRYSVRLGQLAFRGNRDDGRPIFEQKRVDILLGVDMVQLSAKGHIFEAILVAGDSDFIPAVIAAKSEGVLVRLVHGDRKAVHNELFNQVSLGK